MAAKKKRIVKKERTLSEFRAWLEGVEELQGSDWHPDAEQWKLIRAAIDGIVVEDSEPFSTPMHQQQPPHTPPPRPMQREEPRYIPPPPQSSALEQVSPVPQNVEMTPAARAALGGTLPPSMVPDASGKLKTPNIDTSNGEYGSGFE